GGNDSMDTVSKLSAYADKISSDIRFIGIPKTIDNDLVLTDHTPGFGSAAKYVASTVREIALDASVYDNKTSVTIVEIMGRHAGWLTAASALARKFEGDNPVLIYLPETAFDPDRFIESVKTSLESVPNLVVCISEGIHDGNGTFVCELDKDIETDTFGHKMLTGSGKYLENLVKEKLGVKVRSVELNVSQRCSSAMLSGTDLKESAAAGAYGVKCALEGERTKMVAFTRLPDAPYRINYELKDVHQICNQEKTVPLEWITKDGSDVSQEFIDYALPLIQGSVKVPEENGLPQFAYRKKH
ncbi:MAG TPA: diphosphate--fructose-6-phosphate 1-phosphotransferase, partial [Candidatus Mediterraneibacter norfolkensis]|nr:diphosphate--fructose-6-phosphate 1-phosphotransferase [Candidatus Mediterraneibacter norfolkensis]